jgi:hypothetical protein
MYTNVSDQINVRTMELAKDYKPNMDEFNNGKEFGELYHNGITFCQVTYYDWHDKVENIHIRICMDIDKKELLENAMKLYKEKLEECQKIALEEFGIDEYDSRTYYYNNRIGNDFGYCHMNIYVRSEEKDIQERLEREKHYADEYEVSCHACGDGGCIHCEPHRFI